MGWGSNHGGSKRFFSSSEYPDLFWIPPIFLFDWLLAVRPRRESHHLSRHRLHLTVNKLLCTDGLSIPQQKVETVRFVAGGKRLVSFVKYPHQLCGPTSVLSDGYHGLSVGGKTAESHVHYWSASPAEFWEWLELYAHFHLRLHGLTQTTVILHGAMFSSGDHITWNPSVASECGES